MKHFAKGMRLKFGVLSSVSMDRLSQISSKRLSVPFRPASAQPFVSGNCLPHARSAALRRRQSHILITAAQGNENGSKGGDQSKQEKLVQGSFPNACPDVPLIHFCMVISRDKKSLRTLSTDRLCCSLLKS